MKGSDILRNKKILVIMPFFMNYHMLIERVLKEYSCTTYFIEDGIHMTFSDRVLNRIDHQKYLKGVEKDFFGRIDHVPQDIDFVLIINGWYVNDNEIEYVGMRFTHATYVMYQWDSASTFHMHANKIASICQYLRTFDPIDSKEFGWKYVPLFYDPFVCHPQERKEYDFAYICSLHSDRLKIYHKLMKYANDHNKSIYDYLLTDRTGFLIQKYYKRDPDYQIPNDTLKYKKLSADETSRIYDRTRCLVDYKFPTQNGLTIRTIESLGHKCKLVTNNRNIINEDFYDPENIYIYNSEDEFDIPENFINSPYKDVDKEIYDRYSVYGWLDQIFEFEL